MNVEELYEDFVTRYFEGGEREIPEAWPVELRKRCLFFLRMVEAEGSPGEGVQSILSQLERLGASASDMRTSSVSLEPHASDFDLSTNGERYRVEQEVARGGMGRILLAYDRDFRRRIAMKVMIGSVDEVVRSSRFIQEAQTTAQLEHPNIGPVYDIGIDADSNPFFTMKWIRGRNLAQVIREQRENFSLIRFVQTLQQAAMGVHFANSKGVIHRDLKPQNIMVGDFGEVLVVDWGLAKILGANGSEELIGTELVPEESISTTRVDHDQKTLEGSVHGSIPYMAPEQARGEVSEIDHRTDVFGLGAILYEVLTGAPLYVEDSLKVALARARRTEIVPPLEKSPERSIPRLLAEICSRALAADKSQRYQSAKEFHDALQEYIEGIHHAERQTAEANRLVWVAEKLRSQLFEAERKLAQLRQEESELRERVNSYDPEERKKPLWELTEKCDQAEETVDSEFTNTTAAYHAVLSISPQHPEARRALADIFYRRLLASEERGETEAMSLYRNLVEQYDDGHYHAELSGEGVLRVETDPAGATVLLCRFEKRGLLLAEGKWETAGTTPLECSLPQGSYLILLWKEGFDEARYPFVIDRSGPHKARVRLAKAGAIPEGFVQIPGGPTIVGSDQTDFNALPRRSIEVGDFFAAQYPVTFGDYCSFLNEQFGTDADVPTELGSFFGKERYIVRDEHGKLVPQEKLDPRMAVAAVSAEGAGAYCEWLGNKLRKPIRLLTEEEWERCARGADGRLYPWGNGFDWALCKGAPSRQGRPFPDPVGTFERDVSVFGVRDLAGTIRELCAGTVSEGYGPCRGGSWFLHFPFVFRNDFRTLQRSTDRFTDCGFRVGYSDESGNER